VFWAWAIVWEGPLAVLKTLALPLRDLGYAVWLIPAVLGPLVIRKPGAALFGEFVAAVVSALLGGQYGATVIPSGLVQGLGAELVFLAFLYLNWRLSAAILAGIGAGIAKAIFELVVWYPGADTLFATVYTISSIVSGAVIAGFLSWLAVRGLAKTGALDRFASGRETTVRV
jgi:energy-coupling factor transport system substrate-specific component